MHIFLQGGRGVGKSAVIRKTLSLLGGQLRIGGFATFKIWGDDGIYICPASAAYQADAWHPEAAPDGCETPCIARFGEDGIKTVFTEVFDTAGVGFIRCPQGADLIIMDELGFLEKDAEIFKQEVYARLDGTVPILGVLRDMQIPWHEPIKAHRLAHVIRVTEDSRDGLPQRLASGLRVG